MLDFGQFDFGQFDFGQLAEVEIGRSRNWSKTKLVENEIGRKRNWPKSKLIGRSRTDGVCSVSSFSLSCFLFCFVFLLFFTFFLFLLISLFICFCSVSVFVQENLNWNWNPEPCTPLPMDHSAGQPSAGQPSAGQPSTGPPKISLFFSLLLPQISFFFLSLGVVSLNFFSAGTLKCAHLGSRAVVWNPGGPTRPGRRGSHTTARELQTCTFHGPGASNTTKIPRKDPKREKEERNLWREKGRKSAKFWAPHPSGLHPSGPPPFGASTLRGLHPSGPHPSGQVWPKSANKDGQSRFGQSRSQPSGQIAMGCGHILDRQWRSLCALWNNARNPDAKIATLLRTPRLRTCHKAKSTSQFHPQLWRPAVVGHPLWSLFDPLCAIGWGRTDLCLTAKRVRIHPLLSRQACTKLQELPRLSRSWWPCGQTVRPCHLCSRSDTTQAQFPSPCDTGTAWDTVGGNVPHSTSSSSSMFSISHWAALAFWQGGCDHTPPFFRKCKVWRTMSAMEHSLCRDQSCPKEKFVVWTSLK